MSDRRELTWLKGAEATADSDVRRTAWRRHPRRMLRQQLNRFRPGSSQPPDATQPLAADLHEVLDRLKDLPVGYWTYAWEDGEVHHLGPMAQDFWAAFGLGTTDRRLSNVDVDGVLLASVKALVERVEALEAEVAELRGIEET